MADPIKVVVTNSPRGRVQTLLQNPQTFRVLGAADVLAQNPSEGQVLTWNVANHGFILVQPAAVSGIQSAFDQANAANILAQASFNRANANVNNSITIIAGNALKVN